MSDQPLELETLAETMVQRVAPTASGDAPPPIAWRCWADQPPSKAEVALLLDGARVARPGLTDAIDELAELDRNLRSSPSPDLRLLLAVFDAANAQAGLDARVLRYNFCLLWGLLDMPVCPGDHPDRHPAAWIDVLGEAPGEQGKIVAVEAGGVLLASGLVARPARVRLGGGIGGTARRTVNQLDRHGTGPRAETRVLRRVLTARADGELRSVSHWIGLADALTGWFAASVRAGTSTPSDLDSSLRSHLDEVVNALATLGVEASPWPAAAGDAIDERAELEPVWDETIPPGSLVCVERLGLRGADADRPARLWVSRGARPPLVALGERVLAHLTLSRDALERYRTIVDKLADDTPAVRHRPLLALINALDQQRADGTQVGTRDELERTTTDLLAALAEHDLVEAPISPGTPIATHSKGTFTARRVRAAEVPAGQVMTVRRRAFKRADGTLAQQATVEVSSDA